ncbi:histidine kinase [Geoanaerobacter pelophilus]|uniref:Histidine kinase n=2 Tax=Geoanaerobacter pelophilus TaxID=60036 RepID=A0ABQ0MJR7_9BACT|nr:histidine kinase [Geoanaerobacter pelophilus]
MKDMGKAVLYVRDEELLESLKKRLGELGYAEIIASGSTGGLLGDALELRPEVAVIEYADEEQEMGATVKRLWDKLGVPIIMIAQSCELQQVQKWGESLLYTILAKPVREEELVAALVLSVAAARREERLKEEVSALKESIESRKVIEKAKGRLMDRDKLSEAEAFRRMQRLAMDRRISMRQLADAILLTDSIGG